MIIWCLAGVVCALAILIRLLFWLSASIDKELEGY